MSGQKTVLFRETQMLAPGWLFPAMAALFSVIGLVAVLFFREPLRLEGFLETTLFLVAPPLFVLLFRLVRMDTEIDEEGIHVRFAPFVRKSFLFREIVNLHIRKYRPLVEYGGWGIKGWKRSNRAYTLKGNQGLQLELANSDRVLIGTCKPEELGRLVARLGGARPPPGGE